MWLPFSRCDKGARLTLSRFDKAFQFSYTHPYKKEGAEGAEEEEEKEGGERNSRFSGFSLIEIVYSSEN